MDLHGKVALVTGGAVRVGRALTLALAEAGCAVVVHYGRSAESARQTAADAAALGVETALVSADLRHADAADTIFAAAARHFSHVDILVNSAAIFPEDDALDVTDADRWDTLFAINLRAPYLLTQAFARQLPPGTPGRIININDARVFRPETDHFVYRLTKEGLLTMTHMAAQALAPHITVNAVALGAILPPPGQDDAYLQAIADTRIPLRRAGNADIVARNVIHLLRQDFVTGVTIKLDGGEFL